MRRLLFVAAIAALTTLVAPAVAQVGVSPAIPVGVTFPSAAHDIVFDAARQRFYVSVPDQNRIYVISRSTFTIETSIVVAPRPTGLDLSSDGEVLFAALNQAGAVAYIDPDTLQVVATIAVGTLLEHSTTWDVLEAKPNWLFVSANPSSSGLAKIVLIRRDLGNAASVVASGRIIRAGPTFHRDPLQQFVYVGEGFSPNSLYKLSLAQANAPIVLEDNHGSVSGTQHADVSSDGTRIFLASGQILSTATLQQVGLIGSGVSRLGPTAARAYVMTSPTLLTVFDTATMLPGPTQGMACASSAPFASTTALYLSSDETTALALFGDKLCGVTTSPAPLLDRVEPPRARHDAGPVGVTIRGTYLQIAGVPTVTVGGVPATNVVVLDDTRITCTLPPAAPGFADVTVTTGNGTSILARGFARTPAMVSPGNVALGQQLSLAAWVTPTDALALFYSLGPAVSVTLPNLAGTLSMPAPLPLLIVPAWPLETFGISFTVPLEPVLSGLQFVTQTLTFSQHPGTYALSNAATFTIL